MPFSIFPLHPTNRLVAFATNPSTEEDVIAMNILARALIACALLFNSTAFGDQVDQALNFNHTMDYLGTSRRDMEDLLAIRQRDANLSKAHYEKIKSLIGRIYRKNNLYGVFKAAYIKFVHPSTLSRVAGWMNTPIGIKLNRYYKKAHELRKLRALQPYYDAKLKDQTEPNKKNSIMTFMKLSGQIRMMAAMKEGVYLGVSVAINALKSGSSQDSLKFMKTRASYQKKAITEAEHENWLAFDTYLLKEFTFREVDELSKFYSSTWGLDHLKAYEKALSYSLERAALTLAGAMAKGL